MLSTVSRRAFPLIATAISVAVISAGVAWVDDSQSSSGSGARRSTGPSLTAGDEAWARRSIELYSDWAGSAAEHQAAEVVIAFRMNGDYSACMDALRYRRPWQETISPAPVEKDPLLYSFWAAGKLDGYYASKVINGEIGQRVERRANSIDAVDDEAGAELACREQHPGVSDDDVSAVRYPAVVTELTGAWAVALEPVIEAGGDIAIYNDCMESSGVIDQVGARSTDEARDHLSSLMPVGSVPIGAETQTAEWSAYLEVERAFVDADWTCRQGVRASLGDEVSAALDAFEEAHADQIQQARDHWEAISGEASDLGWTPTEPFAGAILPPR